MKQINALYRKMLGYYAGNPRRGQHFVKVHSFAKLIAEQEHLDEKLQFILEAAALVHDIGIKPAEEKYGSSAGPLQEELGPTVAEAMLAELGFEQKVIDRVSYLVGHHHTYSNIDGLDYQILVEADFLVNYYEDHMTKETIEKSVEKIFRTKTGTELAREMFLV